MLFIKGELIVQCFLFKAREHCLQLLEKALFENYTRHFDGNPHKLLASDYAPKFSAIDLEHEVFKASRLANSYKAAIMKKVTEIKKVTAAKDIHISLIPKWESTQTTGDENDEMDVDVKTDGEYKMQSDADIVDMPSPHEGTSTTGSNGVSERFIKKEVQDNDDEPWTTQPRRTDESPVDIKPVHKIRYFFEKNIEDVEEKPDTTGRNVKNSGSFFYNAVEKDCQKDGSTRPVKRALR